MAKKPTSKKPTSKKPTSKKPTSKKPTSNISPVQLGKNAEIDAKRWFTHAGMRVNPAQQDEDGWDVMLAFSPSDNHDESTALFGLGPTDVTCLVQIKGTESRTRGIPILLSNWKKMCNVPLPVFVIIIRYANGAAGEIRDVSLVHVGGAIIEKAYDRIRSAEPERLHKMTMNVPLDDHCVIADPYPVSIRTALLETIGASLEGYVVKKKDWKDNVGYEDGKRTKIRLKFKGTGDSAYEEMARFAVRLTERLPVEFQSVEDLRFDKPMPNDQLGLVGREDVQLVSTAIPPLGHGVMEVYSPDQTSRASVSGDVYVSHAYFPFLPKHVLLVRIVGSFWELVWRKGAIEITVPFPKDGALPIGDVAALARCVDIIMRNPEFGIRIEIPGVPDGDLGLASPNVQFPNDLLKILQGYNAAEYLLRSAGVPAGQSIAVCDMLPLAEWLVRVSVWTAISGNSSITQDVEVVMGEEVLPEGNKIGLVMDPAFRLCGYVLLYVVIFHGWADRSCKSSLKIPNATVTVGGCWCFRGSIPADFSIDEEIAKIATRMSDVDIFIRH